MGGKIHQFSVIIGIILLLLTVMPSPGGAQEGELVFADDFSDPESGWAELAGANYTRGYKNGAYEIDVRSNWLLVRAIAGQHLTDFGLKVEAGIVDGSGENGYGLLFRYRDDDNFYQLIITGDGYYSIHKRERGQWRELRAWTKSPAIKGRGDLNNIEVSCHGLDMSFSVNGQRLVDVKDEALSEGDIGLFAVTFAQPEVRVRFDNLEIWAEPATKIREIDGAEMVYVPAGEFIMGSSDDDRMAYDDEKPQHTVYLDGFWIDKYEVTNARYRKCVDAGACTLPHDTRYYDDPAYADHPVVYVDWSQAKAYAKWAGGRLPTEAEWEKAARGTDGRLWPWGNEWGENKANTSEGGPRATMSVGSYPAGASPYGALDMAGNVWEWTSSLYKDYPYRMNDGREDMEASGRRVLRGGSWDSDQRHARCAYRNVSVPAIFFINIGFRVVALAAF